MSSLATSNGNTPVFGYRENTALHTGLEFTVIIPQFDHTRLLEQHNG